MANKPHRRKLSNFLLDKRLQLRYVAFVSVLSALICGSLGFLIYEQERMASERINASAQSPMFQDDPELLANIADNLQASDTNLLLVMVAVGIGLVVVLSLYLVVFTHKVAGPLHKVSLYFHKWESGILGPVWPLRRGDMLKDFYDNFKLTHETLRERYREVNDACGRLLSAVDSAGAGREAELEAVVKRFRDRHRQRKSDLA